MSWKVAWFFRDVVFGSSLNWERTKFPTRVTPDGTLEPTGKIYKVLSTMTEHNNITLHIHAV